MSFRRLPFQFSTTDPAERQRELEKRFGVPLQNKMYVDAANPLTMGSGFNTSTSSPRFQHRVPMFVEGMPTKSSVDSSACENKTPKVRVIPIEIEKDGSSPSSRHRTFSGPAEISKQHDKEKYPQKEDASTLKRSMEDLSKPSKMKAASGPRVYNVPIKVEQSGAREKKTKSEKGKMSAAKPHPNVNGCDELQHVQKEEPGPSPKEAEQIDERMKINIYYSLKKIDSVLEELKSYETGVKDFNGTTKDKQYRYLDEMLTRCMLKLDDIETMGNEEVRSARKNAVKMVQACIDLLESKVNVANNSDTSIDVHNVTILENNDIQDNAERTNDLEDEKVTERNDKCNIVDIPEENHLVANPHESKSPQNESSISEAPSSEYKPNIPEVEMAEVTSTSSDNQNEKTYIDYTITDLSQSNATNTVSDEIQTQASESNEIEMPEVTTQIKNSQDQEELPKPEVSSTNILPFEKVSVDPLQIIDSNEAEMTDVSSMLSNSSAVQKDEAIPEISSSIIQPEPVASKIKQFSGETVLEHCEITNDLKTEEDNTSNNDTNLQASIPKEVEMKEIVENPCQTNNTLDEQSNLQSKGIGNDEPN